MRLADDAEIFLPCGQETATKPTRPGSKIRTTADPSRREAAERKDGDESESLVGDGRAASMETSEGLTGNPFALFTEWDSEADHKAYDRL
jgi:antitoxin PrlF